MSISRRTLRHTILLVIILAGTVAILAPVSDACLASSSKFATNVLICKVVEEEKVVEDSNPDCGKDPYTMNTIGGHYERRFDKWCEQFTGDPNESLYDGKWYSEIDA